MKKILLFTTFLFSLNVFANISFTPHNYSFGYLSGPFPMRTNVISLVNRGEKTNVLINHNCFFAFTVYNSCPSILAKNQSCMITVQFNPRYDGFFSCQIHARASDGGYDYSDMSGSYRYP